MARKPAAKPKAKPKANKVQDEAAVSPVVQAPAPQLNLKPEGGAKPKSLMLSDAVERAFSDALSETIMHPQGNVDDESFWPLWEDAVAAKVSAALSVRREFVRVDFYRTDEVTGEPFEDSNWVRIQLTAGSQIRNITMVDPTPED